MLKEELARELRQRQYDYEAVDKELIDSLTDDQIVDSYITCSCCGEKQVDSEQLLQIIERARIADDFLALCGLIAKARSRNN